MHFIDVRHKIENSWSKDTTYRPDDYEGHDPAWGQCAVTTALLDELCEEEVVFATGTAVNEEHDIETTHYWTVFRGVDIDLTWRQFPVGTELRDIRYEITREEFVQNKWMEDKVKKMRENYHFQASEVAQVFNS